MSVAGLSVAGLSLARYAAITNSIAFYQFTGTILIPAVFIISPSWLSVVAWAGPSWLSVVAWAGLGWVGLFLIPLALAELQGVGWDRPPLSCPKTLYAA